MKGAPSLDVLPAALEIVPLEARHGGMIVRQASQETAFGLAVPMDEATAAELIAAPGRCWAAISGDRWTPRVVAMFGLVEPFVRRQATAWAVLSDDIGAHHLAITRFCREQIINSPYRRIEAIVQCADAEPVLAAMPDIDAWQLTAALLVPALRTPAVRWACAAGLMPAHVLRHYGAASETHMLFERINGGLG